MTCRQYSKDMDFVFLSSNCILMAAPRTEREAAKYSEFVVEKYKTANRVVDMTSSAYNSYFSDATENYLGMNYYSSIVRYESDFICTMKQLLHFTHTAETWLHRNSKGILIIADEDGVGKSAMAAACLMLHLGMMNSAAKAIDFINTERTPNAPLTEKAISYPCHVRLVYYYESLLRNEESRFLNKTLQLCGVRFSGDIPNYQKSLVKFGINPHIHVSSFVHEGRSHGGSSPDRDRRESSTSLSPRHKVVSEMGGSDAEMAASIKRSYSVTRFNQLEEQYRGDMSAIPFYNRSEYSAVDLDVSDFHVLVRDEVTVDIFSEEIKIASCTFHTAFVDNSYLEFDKAVLDIMCEDSNNHFCSPNTKIALLFAPTVDQPSLSIVDPVANYENEQGNTGSFFDSPDVDQASSQQVRFETPDLKSGVSEQGEEQEEEA